MLWFKTPWNWYFTLLFLNPLLPNDTSTQISWVRLLTERVCRKPFISFRSLLVINGWTVVQKFHKTTSTAIQRKCWSNWDLHRSWINRYLESNIWLQFSFGEIPYLDWLWHDSGHWSARRSGKLFKQFRAASQSVCHRVFHPHIRQNSGIIWSVIKGIGTMKCLYIPSNVTLSINPENPEDEIKYGRVHLKLLYSQV